ncbi:MAG: DUF349 domain-containing protein [Desulfococcaceae bacterium]|nr:DUF349 domain-containing protein [Desulfococcaceae bacterium]
MALTDFMKPRWKHSNPEIRLKAVQEMKEDENEVLQEIAITDGDPDIRMEAIGKIRDEHFLQDFAASKGDSAVIRAAAARLHYIWKEKILSAQDTEQAKAVLAQIGEPDILSAIANETEDPDIRFLAVEKISDPEHLCRIAENNCGLKAGLAIVEKLDSPADLRLVSEKASNKKVKKQARCKLDRLENPQKGGDTSDTSALPAEENPDGEAAEICIRLENMPISENSLNLLAEIRKQWQQVSGENHPLEKRFQTAAAGVEKKYAAYEHAAHQQKVRNEARNICAEAEKLKTAMPEDAPGQMEKLRLRWQACNVSLLPAQEARKQTEDFEKLAAAIFLACEKKAERDRAAEKRRREEEEKIQLLCEQAEALSSDTQWASAEEKWKELNAQWEKENVSDTAAAARFRKAREHWQQEREIFTEKQKKEAAGQEKHLRELCEKAEAACAAPESGVPEPDMRSLQQEWRESGELIPELKNELSPRFQKACDSFFSRQRELRENMKWERWANLNQKEEICLLAESAARSGESEGMAEIIREAQKKWKSIGPVPKENSGEIWKRFHTACDEVYHRCLAQKKELYARLLALTEPAEAADADDSAKDIHWTDTAEKIKEIQTSWNAIGSLPLGLEKDLRRDFQEGCNAFFEKRRAFYRRQDEKRQENLKRKTAICEKAEALSGSRDWNRTAAALRKLQREWKETGPVPRSEGDMLWAEFRAACDRFFDCLKAEEPENLKKKEALCLRVEELTRAVQDEDMEETGRELIGLQKEWKEIGPVPAASASAVWERFHVPCDAFFSRRKAYFRQRDEERSANQARKEELTRRAEALAGSTLWKETADELKALQQEWKNIGPAVRKTEQELWTRFRGACDTFFQRRKDFFAEKDRSRLENLKKKEWLCCCLEALARLLMPENTPDSQNRVATAEHLHIALDYKETILVPGNPKESWDRARQKVIDIQKEWKSTGPVPQEKDEEIWKRFRSAADIFFTSRSGSGTIRKPAGEGEGKE